MVSQVPNTHYNRQFVFNNSLNKTNQNFFLNPHTIKSIKGAEEEKSHKLGVTIGASALLVGGLLMLLMRGGPKGNNKYLNALKGYLERQVQKTNNSRPGRFYAYALRRLNSFMQKCESINNFTALKDIAFKRLMYKTKFTRKIHDWVTNLFDKASHVTVKRSWNKTKNKFTNVFKSMDDLNERVLTGGPASEKITINGTTKNRYEWYQDLIKHKRTLSDTLSIQTSPDSIASRYKKIHDATDGLDEFAWNTSFADLNNFRSKPMWQTFLADDYIKGSKIALSDEMRLFRNKMTYSTRDKYDFARSFIKKAEACINPEDTDSIGLITNLKRNLRLGNNPENFVENIEELRNVITKSSEKFKTTPEHLKVINSLLDEAKHVLAGNEKGAMQEILEIYKKFQPKEHDKIRLTMLKAVNSLDKSIDTESVQYFDKVRDLVVGSAPTDVLSILGTGGVIAAGLHKAKDKDEKTTIALKYGIPAVGAVATSVYCTASLLSGSKSLIFGLLSGWVFNKIGVVVDNWRKKQGILTQPAKNAATGANAV